MYSSRTDKSHSQNGAHDDNRRQRWMKPVGRNTIRVAIRNYGAYEFSEMQDEQAIADDGIVVNDVVQPVATPVFVAKAKARRDSKYDGLMSCFNQKYGVTL